MSQRELMKLFLISVPIRPEGEFADELWKAAMEADRRFGEVIFVCHIKYRNKLELDLREACGELSHMTVDRDGLGLRAFGYPVVFSMPGRTMYNLIAQSEVNLEEPIVVAGEIHKQLLDALERHPYAERIYFEEPYPAHKLITPFRTEEDERKAEGL